VVVGEVRRRRMGVVRLHEYLLTRGVPYRPAHHRRAVTAQRLAAAEHVTGHDVAKTVMVRAGDEVVMVVVPAAFRVDVEAVGRELGREARLAMESEFTPLFVDCEPGAEPPFGNLYGVRVLLDQRLAKREHMVCRDGTHEETIELPVADYVELVRPTIVDVAAPESAFAGSR
jgi:Ala-tRNA(Pro) deacylase